MTTIWKELLFLHGHFARLQDLLDETPAAADARQAAAPPQIARRVSAAPSGVAAADGLTCGNCR